MLLKKFIVLIMYIIKCIMGKGKQVQLRKWVWYLWKFIQKQNVRLKSNFFEYKYDFWLESIIKFQKDS